MAKSDENAVDVEGQVFHLSREEMEIVRNALRNHMHHKPSITKHLMRRDNRTAGLRHKVQMDERGR